MHKLSAMVWRSENSMARAIADGARRLEESASFVNDCDNPPCTSFDIRPAINNSVAAVDGVLYAQQMVFRSKAYHDSEFSHRTSFPQEYNRAMRSTLFSVDFYEDTNNVMKLWKSEDKSQSVSVLDWIQMFLFGISCVIGLLGNNEPTSKRRRPSEKRKRLARR
jgi:hypothetical protein